MAAFDATRGSLKGSGTLAVHVVLTLDGCATRLAQRRQKRIDD